MLRYLPTFTMYAGEGSDEESVCVAPGALASASTIFYHHPNALYQSASCSITGHGADTEENGTPLSSARSCDHDLRGDLSHPDSGKE